jgi:hypothetical protein
VSAIAIISIIAIAASIVVGTGAVAFVFKYGVRLAVLEQLFAAKKQDLDTVRNNQEGFNTRLSLVESAVVEMKQMLPELHKLSAMSDNLDRIVEGMNSFVPRPELNAKFSALDERIVKQEDFTARLSQAVQEVA